LLPRCSFLNDLFHDVSRVLIIPINAFAYFDNKISGTSDFGNLILKNKFTKVLFDVNGFNTQPPHFRSNLSVSSSAFLLKKLIDIIGNTIDLS